MCSDEHTRRVHGGKPHDCGEYVYHRDRCLIPSGSSPRGRGKRRRPRTRRHPTRLIPTWAGKTQDLADNLGIEQAHPRVGGENMRLRLSRPVDTGSSPRGRGKPAGPSRPASKPGLIPAWAGKTPQLHLQPARCAAHPRVGGENMRLRLSRPVDTGSSPRGRGKPAGPSRPASKPGLIPAWAGKTPQLHLQPARCAAHPRVGGENTLST